MNATMDYMKFGLLYRNLTYIKSIRSKAVPFNIKEDYLYCASVIKINKYKRTDLTWSNVETLEYVKKGSVAAEGTYRRQCAQRFYIGRYQDDTYSGSVGAPSGTVN